MLSSLYALDAIMCQVYLQLLYEPNFFNCFAMYSDFKWHFAQNLFSPLPCLIRDNTEFCKSGGLENLGLGK